MLYHASLNSSACFVCARPNSWVSVQLKEWQLSYVCAAGIVIYNRIVLLRFCVQLFVFQFSSRQWRRQGGARGGKCPPKIIFWLPILPPLKKMY